MQCYIGLLLGTVQMRLCASLACSCMMIEMFSCAPVVRIRLRLCLLQVRQRNLDSRGDRYMLLTFEDPPNNIKVGIRYRISDIFASSFWPSFPSFVYKSPPRFLQTLAFFVVELIIWKQTFPLVFRLRENIFF